ncbi:MAG: PIN domain-containing protein [Thermoanaerobaculia bacterium]
MILVDSTIWVAVERGHIRFEDVIPDDEIVAACPAVAHEVLRGAQTVKQYQLALEVLRNTEMFDSPTPYERFVEAAAIYARCRKGGITTQAIDCLIAACAIANRLPLLHQDGDFDMIARHVPELKIFTRS